jgi:hypothetical protein
MPPPGYAAPAAEAIRPGRKRGLGRRSLILILVLVLALLGTAGYVGATYPGLHLGGPASNIPASQPAITTATINATVTYAGVAITVLDAQQSQSFIDDPHTGTSGMVRVYLQEHNNATVPVNLMYTTIASLVLPDGKTVAPAYVKANESIAPGATQPGMLDFAVPASLKVDQLTLRLGAASEAQIDIPLTGHADLSQYAPKTVPLNGKAQYLGLDWTLVSATTQLSLDGQQASKGMRYVILTLKVNNTLSQTAIAGSPYDYMRLKAGDTTATPKDTTLPVSFDAGANGKTGTVTFLAPQDVTTLTLMMIPQNQGGFDQGTIDFQLS